MVQAPSPFPKKFKKAKIHSLTVSQVPKSEKHLDVEIQVRHFVREPLQLIRVEAGVVKNDVVVGEGRHSITPRLTTQQVEVVSATMAKIYKILKCKLIFCTKYTHLSGRVMQVSTTVPECNSTLSLAGIIFALECLLTTTNDMCQAASL